MTSGVVRRTVVHMKIWTVIRVNNLISDLTSALGELNNVFDDEEDREMVLRDMDGDTGWAGRAMAGGE